MVWRKERGVVRRHLKKSNGFYECERCNETFLAEYQMWHHMQTHIDEERATKDKTPPEKEKILKPTAKKRATSKAATTKGAKSGAKLREGIDAISRPNIQSSSKAKKVESINSIRKRNDDASVTIATNSAEQNLQLSHKTRMYDNGIDMSNSECVKAPLKNYPITCGKPANREFSHKGGTKEIQATSRTIQPQNSSASNVVIESKTISAQLSQQDNVLPQTAYKKQILERILSEHRTQLAKPDVALEGKVNNSESQNAEKVNLFFTTFTEPCKGLVEQDIKGTNKETQKEERKINEDLQSKVFKGSRDKANPIQKHTLSKPRVEAERTNFCQTFRNFVTPGVQEQSYTNNFNNTHSGKPGSINMPVSTEVDQSTVEYPGDPGQSSVMKQFAQLTPVHHDKNDYGAVKQELVKPIRQGEFVKPDQNYTRINTSDEQNSASAYTAMKNVWRDVTEEYTMTSSDNHDVTATTNHRSKPGPKKGQRRPKGAPKPTSFPCNICGRTYSYSHLLKRHSRKHDGSKPYKCDTCGHRFRLYDAWKRHLLVHTGEKPLACTQCDRRFRDYSNLKQHMESHRTVNSFVCDTCGRAYKNARLLKQHSCRPVKQERSVVVKKEGKKLWEKYGIYNKDLTNDNNATEGVGKIICKLCYQLFSHNALLEQHLTDVHKKIINGNENKKIQTRKARNPNGPQFCCLYCNKDLASLQGVKLHLLRIHKKEYDELTDQEKTQCVRTEQVKQENDNESVITDTTSVTQYTMPDSVITQHTYNTSSNDVTSTTLGDVLAYESDDTQDSTVSSALDSQSIIQQTMQQSMNKVPQVKTDIVPRINHVMSLSPEEPKLDKEKLLQGMLKDESMREQLTKLFHNYMEYRGQKREAESNMATQQPDAKRSREDTDSNLQYVTSQVSHTQYNPITSPVSPAHHVQSQPTDVYLEPTVSHLNTSQVTMPLPQADYSAISSSYEVTSPYATPMTSSLSSTMTSPYAASMTSSLSPTVTSPYEPAMTSSVPSTMPSSYVSAPMTSSIPSTVTSQLQNVTTPLIDIAAIQQKITPMISAIQQSVTAIQAQQYPFPITSEIAAAAIQQALQKFNIPLMSQAKITSLPETHSVPQYTQQVPVTTDGYGLATTQTLTNGLRLPALSQATICQQNIDTNMPPLIPISHNGTEFYDLDNQRPVGMQEGVSHSTVISHQSTPPTMQDMRGLESFSSAFNHIAKRSPSEHEDDASNCSYTGSVVSPNHSQDNNLSYPGNATQSTPIASVQYVPAPMKREIMDQKQDLSVRDTHSPPDIVCNAPSKFPALIRSTSQENNPQVFQTSPNHTIPAVTTYANLSPVGNKQNEVENNNIQICGDKYSSVEIDAARNLQLLLAQNQQAVALAESNTVPAKIANQASVGSYGDNPSSPEIVTPYSTNDVTNGISPVTTSQYATSTFLAPPSASSQNGVVLRNLPSYESTLSKLATELAFNGKLDAIQSADLIDFLLKERGFFKCKCGCLFADQTTYSLHKRMHYYDDILKCSFCEKKYDTLQELFVHFQSHEK